MPRATVQALHSRSAELAAIDAVLDGGGLLVLEGEPGIGKTSLLAEGRERAGRAGLVVLSAAGTEAEQAFPFGLARRVLEPALRALPTEARESVMSGAAELAVPLLDGSTGAQQDAFAVLHGLYWVVSNLADRQPLAICIDDLQWCDPSTLSFLTFLGRRLDAVDVRLLVGSRPDPAAHELADAGERRTILPFTSEESALLVGDVLGPEATDEVCAVCHAASGGNPFLLTTLVDQLRRDGVGAPEEIAGMAVEEIERFIGRRLSGLGEDPAGLARAAAILGGDGSLAEAADVAELDLPAASSALDRLVEAGVMIDGEPLRFVHPLILAAIRDGLGHGERTLLHAAAARALRARDRSAEAVAAHLLHAPPAGDGETVHTLREAARRALTWGQPSTAASLLRRARQEPPGAADRPAVLLELAVASTRADGTAALGLFADAAAAAPDPRAAVEVALLRARALVDLGRFDELDAVVAEARAVLPEGAEDLATDLAAADASLLISPEHAPAAAGRLFARTQDLVPRTPVEGGLLASRAYVDVVLGLHDEAGPRAAAAVEAMTVDATAIQSEMTLYHACHSAVFSEQFDALDQALARLVEIAQRKGDHKRYCLARLGQAWTAEIRGDLPGCVLFAREALEGFADGDVLWRISAHAQLVFALSMIGDFSAAEALLGPMRAFRVEDMPPVMDPSSNEAILRVMQGRPDEANPIFDRLAPVVIANQPAPFYHAAVVARRAAGRDADALALAEEFHARVEAHPGGPYARGMALRCLAAAHAGDEREIPLLREALGHFEASVARFRHGECSVALGSALRRAGNRADARPHLRTGLDLAQACGARPLAEFAAGELEATGERVRRGGVLTRDELTASELRVCRMAAAGASNPEIAQALFVTKKTIESHLASAYRKLGIRSRAELADALPAA